MEYSDTGDAIEATGLSLTVLHIRGASPEAVEQTISEFFERDYHPQVLRLEGTYRAVLERATDPDLLALHRYLICRPHAASAWTPVIELSAPAEGLDVTLSSALDGATVYTTFVYSGITSGYHMARGGALVDTYRSDPLYWPADELSEDEIEAQRGHPERFSDLLPAGTTPEDFARIVLRPGWWEDYDAGRIAVGPLDAGPARHGGAPEVRPDNDAGEERWARGDDDAADEEERVDEVDRMRCLALALEVWSPSEYPFSQELEALPNAVVGPVIALAFA
jgi:hypothetical protein